MKYNLHNLRFYILVGVAFLALVFIFWAGYLAANTPYDGFTWSNRRGVVLAVAESGPAFRLIEPDDRILAVDDTPLPLTDSIYLGKRPGNTVVFLVERRDSLVSIPILLASSPWDVRLGMVLPTLIALSFWGAGIFVLSFQGGGMESALFLVVCLAASVALAAGSISATGPPLANLLFGLSLYWLVPLGYSFHLVFPRSSDSSKLRIVESLLFAVATIASLVSTIWLPARPGASSISSSMYSFHRIWLALGVMAVVYLLFRSYRCEGSGHARRQVGVVVLGGTTALLLFLGLTLIPDILLHQQILPYNLSLSFLTLIPLTYGYAIAHFRFIPLASHVNRKIASAFALILLLGLFLLLSILLARLTPPELWQHPLGVLFLTILIAWMIAPLKRRVQKFVNRLFYGECYDYPAAVRRVGDVIREADGGSTTGEALIHELHKALQLEYAGIFLTGEGNSSFIGRFEGADGLAKHAGEWFIDDASPLIRYFRSHPSPQPTHLLRQELKDQALSPMETELLTDSLARYWIPVYGSSDLFGILVAGAKLGDGEIGEEDLEILQVIARQAGIALENAVLAKELQQRNRECARLHQQALLAREEERKRLAWELHDQAVQALTGVGYRLAGLRHHLTADGQEPMEKTRENVQQIIDDLRRLCAELRPPPLDTLGLAAAVRYLVRIFGKGAPFRIVLAVEGDEEQLYPEEISVCIYRSLHEALLNAQKHSQAHRVQVRICLNPHRVFLEVSDDGNGFVSPANLGRFSTEGHFGLMGMQERVEMLGGTLVVESAPGRGCWIAVAIPVCPDQA